MRFFGALPLQQQQWYRVGSASSDSADDGYTRLPSSMAMVLLISAICEWDLLYVASGWHMNRGRIAS